jgi:hypothetical protein
MALKWESFTEESFKYKWNNRVKTTNALNIHVSKQFLIRAGFLLFSSTKMFVNLMPRKFFSWNRRDGAWGSLRRPLLL